MVSSTWLAAVGAPNKLAEDEVVRLAGKVILSAPLWALLGIAIGALVQSQVAALVGTLIWMFLGEAILIGVLGLLEADGIADYLPFQALDARTTDRARSWIDERLEPDRTVLFVTHNEAELPRTVTRRPPSGTASPRP